MKKNFTPQYFMSAGDQSSTEQTLEIMTCLKTFKKLKSSKML